MDLNTASISTMAKLVGLESAHDLFLWRPFLSWADVERVPGFTSDQIVRLRRAGAHVKLPGEPLTRREALDASHHAIDRNLFGDRGASL
ncbi:MAG: hypothetical protein JWQ97_1899 [Phenylobacterium sp.]|nr:hypothetical protein [Phenylobacterium sp.]